MRCDHPNKPVQTEPSLAAFELVTNDVDELVRLYPGWNGRFQQVSAGQFQGKIQIIRSKRIRLFRGLTNQSLLTRGESQPGWLDITPVTTLNQRSRWQGRHCDPNHIVARGADVGVDNLAARGSEIITLSVSTDLLRRAAANASPSDCDPASIHWNCSCVDPRFLASFELLAKHIVSEALSNAAYLTSTDYLTLEQHCIVAALRASSGDECKAFSKSSRARAEMVRRGEEYLRENLRLPVGLIDLCEELGVSVRTVQYAFCERFGVGPIEYFRMLRLDAARIELKSAKELD